jgi:hypothetical protein
VAVLRGLGPQVLLNLLNLLNLLAVPVQKYKYWRRCGGGGEGLGPQALLDLLNLLALLVQKYTYLRSTRAQIFMDDMDEVHAFLS